MNIIIDILAKLLHDLVSMPYHSDMISAQTTEDGILTTLLLYVLAVDLGDQNSYSRRSGRPLVSTSRWCSVIGEGYRLDDRGLLDVLWVNCLS